MSLAFVTNIVLIILTIINITACKHLHTGCSSDNHLIESVTSWDSHHSTSNLYAQAKTIRNRNKKRDGKRKGKPHRTVSIPRVIEIPILFHVLYHTSDQNIPFHEIQRTFRGINEDYFGINNDKTHIAEFLQVFGNFSIQFKLNTIYRKQLQLTTPTTWSIDDRMKFDSYDGKNAIDIEHMLNIWICSMPDNHNYAISPLSGPIESDGIVIEYTNFQVDMVVRRIFTHELGHWLNLKHPWGQFGGCNDDDLVDDTPVTEQANFECPNYPHISCNTTDMTANFMDYTNCTSMFTAGQVERGRDTFLDNNGRQGFVEYTRFEHKKRKFVNDIYLINSDSYTHIKCDPGDKQMNVLDVSICVSYSSNVFMDVIDPESLVITNNVNECDEYYVIFDAAEKYLCFSKTSQHDRRVLGVSDIVMTDNCDGYNNYDMLKVDDNLYLGYKTKRYYFPFTPIDHLANSVNLIEEDRVNIVEGKKFGNIEFNGDILIEFDFIVHSLPIYEDCIQATNIMSIGNSYYEDLPGFYMICNTQLFGMLYTHNSDDLMEIMWSVEVNNSYNVRFRLNENRYYLEMNGVVIKDEIASFEFDERFGSKSVYMSQPHILFDAADVTVNNLRIETEGTIETNQQMREVNDIDDIDDYKMVKILSLNVIVSMLCTSSMLCVIYWVCVGRNSKINYQIGYDEVCVKE